MIPFFSHWIIFKMVLECKKIPQKLPADLLGSSHKLNNKMQPQKKKKGKHFLGEMWKNLTRTFEIVLNAWHLKYTWSRLK